MESRTLAGATLLGLSMFATMFLGAILAVFLTLNAVRGDAERGLLQPMVVRPLPRAFVLLGRFLAAGERLHGLRDPGLPRLRGADRPSSSAGGRTA